jgi:hypothetical protein
MSCVDTIEMGEALRIGTPWSSGTIGDAKKKQRPLCGHIYPLNQARGNCISQGDMICLETTH